MFSLLVAFVTLTITIGTVFLMWTNLKKRKGQKNIPRRIRQSAFHSAFEILSPRALEYLLGLVKEYGKVFRMVLPLEEFVVVTDPALARLILEGDIKKSIKGSDKGLIYRRFNALTCGHQSVFTKLTEGEGWEVARKGLAPSFSMANINKRFDSLQNKVNEFCQIMDTFAISGETVLKMDQWMVKLTLDFISTSM
eukprot:gene16441-34309_t